MDTSTLPDALTAADITWRSPAPEPPLDLLMLTTDEIAQYAYSMHEDLGIYRDMVSRLLALLHHVNEERRSYQSRIAHLVADNRELRAEISALRQQLRARDRAAI